MLITLVSAAFAQEITPRADDIRTDNFQEVCDLLGFVPPAFRPEVFGEVQPRFTVVL